MQNISTNRLEGVLSSVAHSYSSIRLDAIVIIGVLHAAYRHTVRGRLSGSHPAGEYHLAVGHAAGCHP